MNKHKATSIFLPGTFSQVIVKLAARCNIKCDYCYWFRDQTVYQKPKLLLPKVQQFFIEKLTSYIEQYNIKQFSIVFHGGEPLLFGKKQLTAFCEQINHVATLTSCGIDIAITTNGILIDNEWCDIFKQHQINIAISLDGDQEMHDASRKDFQGQGTYKRVINALNILRNNKIEPGILGVCLPQYDPENLLNVFVNELKISSFDILIPDYTHEDVVPSIAEYYCKIFDLWYDKYAALNVEIRIFKSIIDSLLGSTPIIDKMGYSPLTTLVLMPDGTLEANDTLKVINHGFTTSQFNIFDHSLDSIVKDSIWREAFESSTNLASPCQICNFKLACGGGSLGSRWSNTNRFNNPSVYCDDLKHILQHITAKIITDLNIEQ